MELQLLAGGVEGRAGLILLHHVLCSHGCTGLLKPQAPCYTRQTTTKCKIPVNATSWMSSKRQCQLLGVREAACSEDCAVATQRLADGLGKEEQALLRWEVVRRREGQKGANSGPLSRSKPKARKPDFAAGSQQAPIMLADIKVSINSRPPAGIVSPS